MNNWKLEDYIGDMPINHETIIGELGNAIIFKVVE